MSYEDAVELKLEEARLKEEAARLEREAREALARTEEKK